MRKLLPALMLAIAILPAQAFGGVLLSEAVHIVGTVSDEEGKPIAGARIDHSGELLHLYQTDADGRFDLLTRAPAVVIRKDGFRGVLARTQQVGEIHVTLQRAVHDRPFPTCSGRGRFGVGPWLETSLWFARLPGVTAGRIVHDVDYAARSYSVASGSTSSVIQHGAGAMWGSLPPDSDVWSSVTYTEDVWIGPEFFILRAGGKFEDSNRWGFIGSWGETASYSNVDEKTAKKLDQFLDTACVQIRHLQR